MPPRCSGTPIMPARRAPIFPSCLPQLPSTGWQGIGVGKQAFATPASGGDSGWPVCAACRYPSRRSMGNQDVSGTRRDKAAIEESLQPRRRTMSGSPISLHSDPRMGAAQDESEQGERDTRRVVLADDDVLLREGLGSLLERAGFEVLGQAGDAKELLSLVRALKPDLVMVDIRMPPTHSTEGLDAARSIRDEFPETGILVLSAYVDVEHAKELLATGERIGYILKARVTDVDEFIDTVKRIARGGSVIDPALVKELVGAKRPNDPLADLSEREREVLALMAEGRSNVGIAHRLWVTEGTVEKHVRSILMKLDLQEEQDDHRRVIAVVTYLESR